MGLGNLEMILPQVTLDGSNPFRTETVRDRWVAVHDKYVSYRKQVSLLPSYKYNKLILSKKD